MKKRLQISDGIILSLMILFCISIIYPFIYAFSYSISDGMRVIAESVVLIPRGFSLDSYITIFKDHAIITATFISIAKTLLGTLLFLFVTGLCAYAMSKDYLTGRKYIFILYVIPMYVSGGLLPYYVLIHDLGLMNNFLVYILPTSFGAFFMFLMKLYFETIPSSLEESAKLDGAGDMIIALKIYFPLSTPVVVTVALFIGVSQWNSWFDALLFITNRKLYPLQLLLQNVLRQNELSSYTAIADAGRGMRNTVSNETIKMAILFITCLPIMLTYPFAQKYFVKGMTMGSVKL